MSRILSRPAVALLTAVAVLAGALVAGPVAGAGSVVAAELVSRTQTWTAHRTAISSDGELVAFEAGTVASGGEDGRAILVRNLRDGRTWELPTANTRAVHPSMSGDGGLVSFWGLEDPADRQLYVVDRRSPEAPVLRQITNTPADLPYQRVGACSVYDGGLTDQSCRPKLSRDGRTFVAPVEQSVHNRLLTLTVDGRDLVRDGAFAPLVDFGPADTRRVLKVTNRARSAVTFPDTGATIEGDARFTVGADRCGGVLEPGLSCDVDLNFRTEPPACAEATAILRLPATASDGQTAVALTAGGGCPAPRQECTGTARWTGVIHDGAFGAETDHPRPMFRLQGLFANKLGLTAVQLENRSAEPAVPVLTADGCPLRFVRPDAAPADACEPGRPIPAGSGCRAFVEYLLPTVDPVVASFHVGDTVYRLSGHGHRRVVAAWRDPSGAGNFGASGPARIVSAAGPDDTPIEGFEPSVSADGRWIGFTSANGPDRSLPLVESPNQVYLHDTDARGNGSHQPGRTLLASGRPDAAGNASVSDDGTRVAFTTYDDHAQVRVRDLRSGTTVQASAGPAGEPGDDNSLTPELSGDGGTVTYTSSATNLGGPAVDAVRVYVRDLTADFAGRRSVNELASVRPDGSAGDPAELDQDPSINQDGTRLALQTDARLDPLDGDDRDDVYRIRRQTSLVAAPAALDFGRVPVRTSRGPLAVAVRNDGTAVARLGPPAGSDREFRIASDRCTGRVLRPGGSCVYTIRFTPAFVGARTGSIRAVSRSGAVEIALRGTGVSDAEVAGETTHDSPDDGPHDGGPAISADGRYLAYRALTPPEGPNSIQVRDRATGNTWRATPDRYADVGPPELSGDGRVLAYTLADGDDRSVRAVDRVRRSEQAVTGTATDVPFQRPARCASDRACRPTLSDDGRTIAYPARIDAAGSALSLTSGGDPVTNALDFGRGSVIQATLTITARKAVGFAGRPVIEAGSRAFGIQRTDCAGSLAAGASCTVTLRLFTRQCDRLQVATLRVPGTTPDGQTAIKLIGNGTCTATASVRAPAACAPLPAPRVAPSPGTGARVDFGDVAVGGTAVTALVVRNGSDTSTGTIQFGPAGCEAALTVPREPAPGRPPPCRDGAALAPAASCTAYVIYRPATVGPAATGVSLWFGNGDEQLYRFTGNAYREVVIVRSDPAGRLGPARIVGAGRTMTGGQPSLSGDGRYVAFVSAGPQVYRHDLRTGATALISKLSNGKPAVRGAFAPSLSGTGERVAFTTVGLDGGTPSQVWVRDLRAARTVLASAADGSRGRPADGWSGNPALSDDGTTVAFDSDAADLVGEPGNARSSVYVRYLEPDFGGPGGRFAERVAVTDAGTVPETGESAAPAISADGAFTAFGSTSRLVATDNDDDHDAYVRRRFAQLSVEPAAADLGATRIGTRTGRQRLTVRNSGVGPATTGPSSAATPFAPGSQRCATTLHRGRSCTIDATFSPTTAGRADGLLTIPNRQGYLVLPPVAATLTGVGTAGPPVARFTVTPGSLAFGARPVGRSGPDARLTLHNTGDVPLAISGQLTAPDGDFAAAPERCATVMPAARCVLDVSFVARGAGSRRGRLLLRADSQDPAVADPAPAGVELSGTGTASPGQPVAAMRVTPVRLAFRPQVVTSLSAAQPVLVSNTGTVPLAVRVRSTTRDFVADASACRTVAAGARCAIAVRFRPRRLGAVIDGGLLVDAATTAPVPAPFPVAVALRGSTAVPALKVEPAVAVPGQAVTVTGRNFAPGRVVPLTWQPGLGSEVVTPDRAGRFETTMLVFTRDVLGPRQLAGTIPGLPVPVLSAPLLVRPDSPAPPSFVTRW